MSDLYDQVALFCFRYLNVVSFDVVDRMTIPEYLMHLKAYALRSVDEEMKIHLSAFLNLAVKSTRGTGNNIKPKYPTFKSFFDYDRRLAELEHPKDEPSQFQNWRAYKKRKSQEVNADER